MKGYSAKQKMINTNGEMLAAMNNQTLNDTIFEQRAPHLLTDLDYKLEQYRRSSFTSHWPPNAPLTVHEMVAAGLYFTGPGDRVQCAWCGGGLYNWEAGDIALSEHTKHFPKCPFIEQKLSETVGNQRQNNVAELSDLKKPKESSSYSNQIVKQLGYDDDIIAKGVKLVQKIWGKDLTSCNLLDAIYEIESEEIDQTVTSSSPNGACNILTDMEELNHNDILSSKTITTADNPETEQSKTSQPTQHKIINGNSSLFDETELKAHCEENKRLKLSKTCKICLDNEVNVLFLPCRHLVCCERCGDSVKHCPLCRTQIVATVKAFLS